MKEVEIRQTKNGTTEKLAAKHAAQNTANRIILTEQIDFAGSAG